MASLNHVCMWSEHGWKRVTAAEAAKIFPLGTVSVNSGLFMCELCGQYVTLTDGSVRTRYFKHSAYEANKNCPERTFGATYEPSYIPGEHELPIRIKVTENSFSLELGLLYVPQEILQRQDVKVVSVTTLEQKKFIYSFERLNAEAITYVSIGEEPSRKYWITSTKELQSFWPTEVKGISSTGSVFENNTGKMLPSDADVKVGWKYLILTCDNSLEYRQIKGLQISRLSRRNIGWRTWNVYEVIATELSESAAKFFLNLHCRLTDIPVRLVPVWPLHIETPYVVKHNEDTMIMYVSGNRKALPKAFPYTPVFSISCPHMGHVAKIPCKGRQQLVSAGEANVLQYVYLWREPLNETADAVVVRVSDISDGEVKEGLMNELPDGNILRVIAPYDGWIVVRGRNQSIYSKIPITAKITATVIDLHFGQTIQVVQGLDVVWQVAFEKPQEYEIGEDEALYTRLMTLRGRMIPINHSLGSAAVKLRNYTKTRQWLAETARNGFVSEKAMKYLRKYMAEHVDASRGDS